MLGVSLRFLSWAGLGPVPFVASLIGTTEPALNLLISILLGYPLAIIYHKFIRKQNEFYHNIYFVMSGVDVAFFNFGFSLYHNAVPALILYATTMIFGPGGINVIITFIFNMGYLLTGYIMTESEDYDITWTMPQCVLTLKLIALSFDLWDGKKVQNMEYVSRNAKLAAVETTPSFLELFAFVYFPACFLVGPIFSFRRYKDFVSGKYPLNEKAPEYTKCAMTRLVHGLITLVAYQIGVTVFDVKYMLSDKFWEDSIFYRHIYCGLWAHFALYKYISCWLITEASCIRFGLSYNGQDPKTGSKWDGCNNVKMLRFLSATKFQHYIISFNCNTNHFAAEYVYKRLSFLGSKQISQLLTLLFLAVWHGMRSGYYMTFFNEFMIIYMEKELETIVTKTELYQKMWSNQCCKYLMYGLLKMYTIIFMGWSLVPFDLKVFSKWSTVYCALYFSGFIFFLPWQFVYKPLILHTLKRYNKTGTKSD